MGELREQMLRNRSDLKARLHRLTAEARPVVRGQDMKKGGKDPKYWVDKALQTLVYKIYSNRPLLWALSYSEADISRSLRGAEGLFGGEGSGLIEA